MKIVVLFALMVISVCCYGQSNTYRHAASAEFLGLGGSISARYDYMFNYSSNGFFNASVGVGGFSAINSTFISTPHAITYNFGRASRFFEVGLGGTYAYRKLHNPSNEDFPLSQYTAGPVVGYRSISKTGFQFRVYGTAFITDERVMPWIGFGFGKAFRKKG